MTGNQGPKRRWRPLAVIIGTLVALATVAALASSASAGSPRHGSIKVQRAEVVRVDGGDVDGRAVLLRTPRGVHGFMRTTVSGELYGLPAPLPLGVDWQAGDATTLWFVVFNNPGACSDPCGEDDIIAYANGSNTDTGIQVSYASGKVADDGIFRIGGRLKVGDESGFNAPIWVPLDNPMTAEIHLLLRSHGPSSEMTSDQLHEALSSYNGACDAFTCGEMQAAVFTPPVSTHR